MKALRLLAAVTIGCALLLSGAARADTKVEIKNVHLCCKGCTNAVDKILKAEGVQGTCDQKAKTVTISAADEKTAQKVLDALAAGRFHGNTDTKNLTVKDDSGATAGKVNSVTVTDIHNCCNQC